MTCITIPVSVDGGFTEWTEWGMCTKTCGVGNRSRSRDCASPAPQYGGDDCDGRNIDFETCNIHPCPGECKFLVSAEINKTSSDLCILCLVL